MKTTFRLGIAAAVVVIAAILGFTYLNNQVGTGPLTPTPSLTDSATESPTSTPAEVKPLPAVGDGIEPGRYSLHIPDSTVSAVITVGPGWDSGGSYIVNRIGISYLVSFWLVGNVPRDVCDQGTLPNPPIGPTVDDLVAALDAQVKTDMSVVGLMDIGGYPATVVTIAEEEGVACGEGSPYFVTPSGLPGREWTGFQSRDTLWIVDVDGHRIVIATTQSDLLDFDVTTTIREVIDSVEFLVPETSVVQPSASTSVAWRPFPQVECAELEAATYRAPIGSFSVTVSLPSGWAGGSDQDGFNVKSRGSCLFAGAVTLTVSLVSQVYSNACDGQGTAVETGNPAAVTAALAVQTGHETSGPSDTTIAGYPATRFEFSVRVDARTCHLGPLWLARGGGESPTTYEFGGPDSFVTVYVVDVDGSALCIAVDSGAPDEPADLTKLDAIVASMRIEP